MSDSEDEARQQTSVPPNRDLKYKCPAEFVSFSYVPTKNALLDGDTQELWLIKTPARFDPKCFDTLKLPLSGVEVVQSSGANPQVYSVFSGGTAPSDLHLLKSNGKNKKPSLFPSGFNGVLKISESYGNCSENQGPVPIPAAPAPCIPDGLKQRFQPFGSTGGAHTQEEAAGVSPSPTKNSRQDPGEGEERKKKKKKKKDKRQEDSEPVFIKQEETHVECDQLPLFEFMEEEPTEERRRKKKKVKKERECEIGDVIDASMISKTEPMDPAYDCLETPTKHKKKKKSSRNE